MDHHNPLYDRIKLLPVEDMQQMIKDYEQFEKDGKIGDCLLRRTAQDFITENRMSSSAVVHLMKDFAFECLRFFYRISAFHTTSVLNTET